MKNKGFGIGIRDRGDMRRGKAGGGMRDWETLSSLFNL